MAIAPAEAYSTPTRLTLLVVQALEAYQLRSVIEPLLAS